jgi:hypothetical protein
MPASTVHGFLQNELGKLIGNHLRGCEVVAHPGVIPRPLSLANPVCPFGRLLSGEGMV